MLSPLLLFLLSGPRKRPLLLPAGPSFFHRLGPSPSFRFMGGDLGHDSLFSWPSCPHRWRVESPGTRVLVPLRLFLSWEGTSDLMAFSLGRLALTSAGSSPPRLESWSLSVFFPPKWRELTSYPANPEMYK